MLQRTRRHCRVSSLVGMEEQRKGAGRREGKKEVSNGLCKVSINKAGSDVKLMSYCHKGLT